MFMPCNYTIFNYFFITTSPNVFKIASLHCPHCVGYAGGWWKYDSRTNDEIERAYNAKEIGLETTICGNLYVIDFVNWMQYRKEYPDVRRAIKREHRGITDACHDVKGVAGIANTDRAAYNSALWQQRPHVEEVVISDSDDSTIDLT